MKKFLSITLSFVMIFCALSLPAFACTVDDTYDDILPELQEQFIYGEGPETDGYTIDYRYFSPVEYDDTTKYPLVIWLHGMGDGAEESLQVTKSDIAFWTSEDFQNHFKGSNGAFIFAPRSLEEQSLHWPDTLIYPLRATIDDFIAKNKDNIDLTRIYIGGYSMGGKMTLKMAVAYPELFAAIFPVCPAWTPSIEALNLISDIPVWMTSGKLDPLVNYFFSVKGLWKNIVATHNSPADCRFSSLTFVKYPSGNPTSSSHHSWFAVNHDMFSSDNGKYPYMKTVDGLGNKVTLTYPDGMISWLSSFTSEYDGSVATDSGNIEAQQSGEGPFAVILSVFDKILGIF